MTICPTCGGSVPDDECTWIFNGKYYCSETCCRGAAQQ